MCGNLALYLRITHALHRQTEIVRLAYYIHGSLERGHNGMRLLGRINGRRINGRRAQAECFQGESFLLNHATTFQRLPCLP